MPHLFLLPFEACDAPCGAAHRSCAACINHTATGRLAETETLGIMSEL
jgi:hypothetical protein